jgi:2-keto-3-deoxy-L-rhamnonate aldolase RhmA
MPIYIGGKMYNAKVLKEKISRGEICVGTCISFRDATVTEALCNVLDFVWIDMEHSALSVESVQAHVMATKGSNTVPLVRVAWNDPALIKPILDLGAAGIIVPMIRSADDARRAVAACRYPPDGIRSFGPRRTSNYGFSYSQDFCRVANAEILTIVQIEHIDAVHNLDEILAVPGLSGIILGPNDLSGSMGHMGQPKHPEVLAEIEKVVTRARQSNVFVGAGVGDDPQTVVEWVDRRVQLLAIGDDYSLMLQAAKHVLHIADNRISTRSR